jgi:hypothetical protein
MCLIDEEKQALETELAAAEVTLAEAKKHDMDVRNERRKREGKTLLRSRNQSERNQSKRNRDQYGRDRSERVDAKQDRDPPAASARGNRIGADPWHAPNLLSPEETARLALVTSGVAPAPTPERLAQITQRAHELYHKDLIKVCAVCDQQRFTTDPLPWKGERHLTMLVTQLPSYAHHFLAVTDAMELHPDLRGQYNVSDQVPVHMVQHVKDLLLSPRGMGTDGNITMCRSCHQSLLEENMPKFAIANGSSSFCRTLCIFGSHT